MARKPFHSQPCGDGAAIVTATLLPDFRTNGQIVQQGKTVKYTAVEGSLSYVRDWLFA